MSVAPVTLDLFAVHARQAREQRVEMPPSFVHGSETSRLAAVSVRGKTDVARQRVLDFITRQADYGATDSEVELGTGMSGNTIRPRRGELETQGRIRNSGRTRATKSGRAAVVWVAAAAGDHDGAP